MRAPARETLSGRLMVVCLLMTALIGLALVAGLSIPHRWIGDVYIIGRVPGSQEWHKPPFSLFTRLEVFNRDGLTAGPHLYLLGSDAGGRDLLALMARGALPSLALVASALLGRLLIGVGAGIAMAFRVSAIRLISRGMGGWFAGFPYLALAIILVQLISPTSRFLAFVIAMSAVGWRDIAEITAQGIESVLIQPFSLAAKALGTEGLAFIRRHLVPHLLPRLALEVPFQASATMVLLAELGYLNVYLGGKVIQLLEGGRVATLAYRLPVQPELGQLLADARSYILREEWAPVIVPAIGIVLIALAFDILGFALRLRTANR